MRRNGPRCALCCRICAGAESSTSAAVLAGSAAGHGRRARLTYWGLIAEAAGNLEDATDGYAEAVKCWQKLGVVPELGYALLGRGRTLAALGETAGARETLTAAHATFQTLQAAPALAEIDLLLERVTYPPPGTSRAPRDGGPRQP